MIELYFLKPHNVDEIAEQTGKKKAYLEDLLRASGGKTVNLQFETREIPEGFGRTT